MEKNTRVGLLVGAAVVLGGTGLAFAQMGTPAPRGPVQGLVHHGFADRLFADFDSNHDGKITRAEFDTTLARRFADATHGGKTMTADQFASIHRDDFVKRATAMFRRLNWSGNGQLTLEEFAAPRRVRFQRMDRDGSGTVSCNPVRRADFRNKTPDAAPEGGDDDKGGMRDGGRGGDDQGGMRNGWRGHGWQGGHRFGRFAQICNEAGTGGTITRAAFDQTTAKNFQQATGGATTMNLQQFVAMGEPRYRAMTDRMFKRLDKANDGKITLAEFTAPQDRMFVIMDRDSNGFITADELNPRGRRGRDGGKPVLDQK
jgi:Ca2+-binding EF-hand superfamily protein